jgi:hypothetical protein
MEQAAELSNGAKIKKRPKGINRNFVITILYHIVRSFENILTGPFRLHIISSSIYKEKRTSSLLCFERKKA